MPRLPGDTDAAKSESEQPELAGQTQVLGGQLTIRGHMSSLYELAGIRSASGGMLPLELIAI